MLLGIQHRTELTYGDRVSESVMELRVMPRSDKNQTLRAFTLKVGPEAPVFSHRDWMDNQAHHFTIVAFHDRVLEDGTVPLALLRAKIETWIERGRRGSK